VAKYEIHFARSARKELERLPDQLIQRALRQIRLLSEEPRPRNAVKLAGRDELWRIRAGDYRVVYEINDAAKTIDIALIRHRSEVYRNL
jgi:mRNA interferase RelE/StbE